MVRMIELKDGRLETILSEKDFLPLVEQYMGYEAADYVLELLKDLEYYREYYEYGDDE